MLTNISDLQFEPGEAVALRLAQIAIHAMDIDATERPYRLARMVTRTFPAPGANKMLDAVRRRQRDRA